MSTTHETGKQATADKAVGSRQTSNDDWGQPQAAPETLLKQALKNPRVARPEVILQLQRQYGNRAVRQMVAASGLVQRDFQPEVQFAGRNQKSVGVGEVVNLSVKPDISQQRSGRLKWEIRSSNGGTISATGQDGTAQFTAGEDSTNVMLACIDTSDSSEVDTAAFTVVAPNDGYMKQTPGSNTRHLPNSWNVSFVGNQFLRPTDVSFHNVEFTEWDAPAEFYPSPKEWMVPNQKDHERSGGGWTDVLIPQNGEGSMVDGDDWVSTGNHQGKGQASNGDIIWNTTEARLSWNIPWLYRVKPDGQSSLIKEIRHTAYDYGMGKARLTKGGVDVSADAEEEGRWFFPTKEQNIEFIQKLYPKEFNPQIAEKLNTVHLYVFADVIAARRDYESDNLGKTLMDRIVESETYWSTNL
jgi:hypothetical protein